MSAYKYYTEKCTLCGKEHSKREMNKIYFAYGHTSVSSPKKLCSICDDCFPSLCDFLGVPAPDEEVKWRSIESCPNCGGYVGNNANYCKFCGAQLKGRTGNA